MQLENYLDFLSDQDIRIEGTRIGIETVLEDFLEGASPEEIVVRYPNLTLEQIYAVITYYLANRAEIDAYMAEGRRMIEEAAQMQDKNPPAVILRLRRLKEANAQSIRQAAV